MRARIAELGMAAAIAERVELLDVSKLQASLVGHPASKADLQRAVLERRKRAEG
jgi:hypothetical protein